MVGNWNDVCNYCDPKELLSESFNSAMNRAVYYMFQKQHDWIWMAGERGKGTKPAVKSLDALYDAWVDAWNEATFGRLDLQCGLWGYVGSLIDDDIELDEETEYEYHMWLGDLDNDE